MTVRFVLQNKTIVVTGASRGIGLEFARQLLAKGNRVVAAVRNPEGAADLKSLKDKHSKDLIITHVDVADNNSIQVLINNAGILQGKVPIEEVEPEAMLSHFITNCMGPLFVVQAMLRKKLLPQGSLIANITSSEGSLTVKDEPSWYPYRCSKAAANMASKMQSIELEPRGITVATIHPGFVRTELNKGEGSIDTEESVRGMIEVIESGQNLNGEYLKFDNSKLTW